MFTLIRLREGVFLVMILCITIAASLCHAEEVTLTTIMPSQDRVRGKEAAIGTSYKDSADAEVADNNLIVEGNIGIGTTSPSTSKGTSGYIDVKDIYLRDSSKWVSEGSLTTYYAESEASSSPPGSMEWTNKVTLVLPANGTYVVFATAEVKTNGGGAGSASVVQFIDISTGTEFGSLVALPDQCTHWGCVSWVKQVVVDGTPDTIAIRHRRMLSFNPEMRSARIFAMRI